MLDLVIIDLVVVFVEAILRLFDVLEHDVLEHDVIYVIDLLDEQIFHESHQFLIIIKIIQKQ
jgi:hypothetical protein